MYDCTAHNLPCPSSPSNPDRSESWGCDSTGQNTHEWIESIAAVISPTHDMSVLLGSTVATPLYAYI